MHRKKHGQFPSDPYSVILELQFERELINSDRRKARQKIMKMFQVDSSFCISDAELIGAHEFDSLSELSSWDSCVVESSTLQKPIDSSEIKCSASSFKGLMLSFWRTAWRRNGSAMISRTYADRLVKSSWCDKPLFLINRSAETFQRLEIAKLRFLDQMKRSQKLFRSGKLITHNTKCSVRKEQI